MAQLQLKHSTVSGRGQVIHELKADQCNISNCTVHELIGSHNALRSVNVTSAQGSFNTFTQCEVDRVQGHHNAFHRCTVRAVDGSHNTFAETKVTSVVGHHNRGSTLETTRVEGSYNSLNEQGASSGFVRDMENINAEVGQLLSLLQVNRNALADAGNYAVRLSAAQANSWLPRASDRSSSDRSRISDASVSALSARAPALAHEQDAALRWPDAFEEQATDEEAQQCPVCLDRRRSVAASCGHTFCCACLRRLHDDAPAEPLLCPTCRARVTAVMRVFL